MVRTTFCDHTWFLTNLEKESTTYNDSSVGTAVHRPHLHRFGQNELSLQVLVLFDDEIARVPIVRAERAWAWDLDKILKTAPPSADQEYRLWLRGRFWRRGSPYEVFENATVRDWWVNSEKQKEIIFIGGLARLNSARLKIISYGWFYTTIKRTKLWLSGNYAIFDWRVKITVKTKGRLISNFKSRKNTIKK